MRLETIQIENFRSFKNETVQFDPYTCLVGANGAGKSTILTALNVFFRNNASTSTNVVTLCEEDFHHGDTSLPIKITLTFKDLSEEAKKDLDHYFRQDRLVVSAKAIWNTDSKTADVRQYGVRNVMKAFAPYFKATEDGERAPRLKEIYEQIQKEFPDLANATSGPTRLAALREYEEAHPELCEPLDAETQFFGFTKGTNLLDKYIQWVYVPAVKDASTEQQEGSKGALKELLDRTVRSKVNFKDPIDQLKKDTAEKYRTIIDAEQETLGELQKSLHGRLKDWSNPGCMLQLNWHFDDNKSVIVNEPSARASIGEDSFLGEVARLGHGMQRSFLITLLHELASLNADQGPTLLLGFEEPELYQHPPQAQHIAEVLETLATSEKTNAQIVVSTHSPYFVASRGFESVRLVRKHFEDKCSLVAATTFERVEAILANATGDKPDQPTVTMATMEMIMQPSQREIFFTRVAVLVEGLEDVGFIATHLVLNDRWNEFRRLGCHFVIASGKTNMTRPLAIARELCIKTYAVIDGDTDKKNKDEQRKDNLAVLRICELGHLDPMPTGNYIEDNCAVWAKSLASMIREEAGQETWDQADRNVRKRKGFEEGLTAKKKLYVAAIMEELAALGFTSPSLNQLCSKIFAYAEHSKEALLAAAITKARRAASAA